MLEIAHSNRYYPVLRPYYNNNFSMGVFLFASYVEYSLSTINLVFYMTSALAFLALATIKVYHFLSILAQS
jgi:hypothetical protein